MMKPARRRFLQSTAAASLAAGIAAPLSAQLPADRARPQYVARKDGPIRHSVMGWCFRPMKAAELAKHCVAMGITGIEGISRDDYKMAMSLDLEISLVSGAHGFKDGPCDPKYVEKVVTGLKEAIEFAADIGAKKVITFTGMRFKGMDDDKAATRCVDAWKKVMPLAEKKGIRLVL